MPFINKERFTMKCSKKTMKEKETLGGFNYRNTSCWIRGLKPTLK